MASFPRCKRLLTSAASLAVLSLVSACDELNVAPEPSPHPSSPDFAAMQFRESGDSSYDHFEATVTLTIEDPIVDAGTGSGTQTRSYSVTKTLEGDTIWRSTVNFDPFTPLGEPFAGGMEGADIGSGVVGGSDGELAVWSRNGDPVNLDPAVTFPSPDANQPIIPDDAPPFPAFPPEPSAGASLSADHEAAVARSAGSTGFTRQASDTRRADGLYAWVDRIVVTQAARARLARQRSAHFRADGRDPRGLDRFTRAIPGGLIEQLVDPAIGVPLEENVVVGGRLRMRHVATYIPQPGGVYLRSMLRTEFEPPPGVESPRVVTLRYNNIVLERRSDP